MSAELLNKINSDLIFWNYSLARARSLESWVQILHCQIEIARLERRKARGHA